MCCSVRVCVVVHMYYVYGQQYVLLDENVNLSPFSVNFNINVVVQLSDIQFLYHTCIVIVLYVHSIFNIFTVSRHGIVFGTARSSELSLI